MPDLCRVCCKRNNDVSEEIEETDLAALSTSIDDPVIRTLICEYFQLELKQNRTEEEDDRLADLLNQACLDDCLNFWLLAVDYLVGQRQGYLDKSHLKSYNASKKVLQRNINLINQLIELGKDVQSRERIKQYSTVR